MPGQTALPHRRTALSAGAPARGDLHTVHTGPQQLRHEVGCSQCTNSGRSNSPLSGSGWGLCGLFMKFSAISFASDPQRVVNFNMISSLTNPLKRLLPCLKEF